jgi:hypothetical protein
LLDFKEKIWFFYPVYGANRSEHNFGFMPASLGLSHLPRSAPRFLAGFSLFADRSVHGSLLPLALDFCRPCLAFGSVPVGPSLLAVQAPSTAFQSQFLRCCFAYAATVLVWSTSEIRHPHRSSPVVIFYLHALASGLIGVFTPKRAAQTKLKFLFSFLLRWLCLGISECWLALLI